LHKIFKLTNKQTNKKKKKTQVTSALALLAARNLELKFS